MYPHNVLIQLFIIIMHIVIILLYYSLLIASNLSASDEYLFGIVAIVSEKLQATAQVSIPVISNKLGRIESLLPAKISVLLTTKDHLSNSRRLFRFVFFFVL